MVTIDGKYSDFSQIGWFVQSWSKHSSKNNYAIYFKFEALAKVYKNRSVGNIGFWCSYIISEAKQKQDRFLIESNDLTWISLWCAIC